VTARATAIDATLARVQPDVLAVQEAWSTQEGGDQIAALAQRHGYHHLAHHHPAHRDRGLGLLSRWPLVTTAVVTLPAGQAPTEHRLALAATVSTPVGPRPLYVTHLKWRRDHGPIRRAQLATIARHLAEHTAESTRAVVCGDLNAEPGSDEIRMMTGLAGPAEPGVVFEDAWVAATGTTGPGHTWTHRNPYAAAERLGDARIDYILVRLPGQARGAVIDAQVIDGDHDGIWGSDHSALLTTLDLS
jgi:endonuclease/exonuclease/phosphatase family metal-dependent hydrolase